MNTNIDITIIGSGLTGLTAAFYLKKAGKKIAVLEKNDRTGGVIQTIRKDGFIYEAGPNTGVYSTFELVRLFDDLDGLAIPEFANQKGKQRWIWKSGKWHALPSGLISAVSTPLFTPKDKFRILAEPFRKRGTNPDETVAGLVKRRMGKSYLDYAVDPFISGIYAGYPDQLITRYALPKLYRLEQNYGSFIGGSIKKRKEPKDELTKRATREVFSVKGGLQKLTDAMAGVTGSENIYLNASEIKIDHADTNYVTSFSAHNREYSLHSKYLVTATGAKELKGILKFIEEDELKPVETLPYAKVIQVVAGYRKWNGIPLDAFGGLVPSKEKRKVLGVLFTSSIFNNRAPEGGAVLSVFLGGIKHPELFEKEDDEIQKTVLNEISEMLGQKNSNPDILNIFRYKHAIPQYDITSGERLSAISKIESEHPGLFLGGNIRDGIGMADRVKQGYEIAQQILNEKNR